MIPATLLELAMLVVFVRHQSTVGLLLWLAYFYYSATCALVFRRIIPDGGES